MKKITVIVITVMLVGIIGVALAAMNWNSNIFTATAFQNTHKFGEWKNTEVTKKYSYEEVRKMAEGHNVYWIHEGSIDGIGIEVIENEVILVFNTNDKRLTTGLGSYKIWY